MTVNAMKAGAEDFLTKPVSAETLLAAIARALARHQSQLEELNRLKAGRALVDKLTRANGKCSSWLSAER